MLVLDNSSLRFHENVEGEFIAKADGSRFFFP